MIEKIENDDEKYFVAIDTETTGLSPIYNELIEVSAIKYRGKEKIDTFSTLIKPKVEIPYYITKITGISNEMVENSPSVEEIMPDLVNFIGNYPIVAHNAGFDIGFLQNNSKESFSNNKVIDTVRLSRQMHPFLPNHKLGTVAKYIGVTEEGYHRAEFDCECCAKIYMKYIGMEKQEEKTEYRYKPEGVCSKEMIFQIERDIVKNVQIIGGCKGNSTGVSQLIAGMKIKDIIKKLKGISCKGNTSCPDQLAKALESYIVSK